MELLIDPTTSHMAATPGGVAASCSGRQDALLAFFPEMRDGLANRDRSRHFPTSRSTSFLPTIPSWGVLVVPAFPWVVA
jgi:hypothetical protein